jgi:hypothetical protein
MRLRLSLRPLVPTKIEQINLLLENVWKYRTVLKKLFCGEIVLVLEHIELIEGLHRRQPLLGIILQ